MTAPPSRPEARSRFGPQSASELGAPVASSIPEQLPGHEPASARKGYEDGNALVWRYRCVEESCAPLIHDDTFASRAAVPTWADWFRAAGIEGVNVTRGLRFNSSDHALDAASEGAG